MKNYIVLKNDSDVFSEPCQTPKVEHFAKLITSIP